MTPDNSNPYSSNPYVTVGSPNYATPVLNMFGSPAPTQGQQANQQNKPGQPTNNQQQPDYYELLKRLFGSTGSNPMQLGPDAQLSQGNPGGTAGVLPGLY